MIVVVQLTAGDGIAFTFHSFPLRYDVAFKWSGNSLFHSHALSGDGSLH
jgi:hypothetical protein